MQEPKLRIPIRQDHNKPIMTDNLRTVPAELQAAESPENSRFFSERTTSSVILPECLSISEASERTNLSDEYLRYLCRAGKINYLKCGKKYMIDSGSLAEFIKRGGAD